jgi:hypothetical protein
MPEAMVLLALVDKASVVFLGSNSTIGCIGLYLSVLVHADK